MLATGLPVDALLLVEGEMYAAPRGTLEVAGFAAGRARVVVARRGVRGGGVELHMDIEEGRVAERRVVLPE